MTLMVDPERLILHLDMDAFFAAVEQRDHPELRGRPVLVGGDPNKRGVVSTASYEARPFGCHSAMPMAHAVRLCPQAVVIPPRMDRYVEVSRQVIEILEQFTPLVEPLSIDEAFMDVSGSIRLMGPPERLARELKNRINAATQLTASVGMAPGKFVAKLASDHQKPDGLLLIPPSQVQSFLDPLPISRLWGVGKATLPRFEELGVRTFADARRMSEDQLCGLFGESGRHFHQLVRGIDDRRVVPDRAAKSISHEMTFPQDVEDEDYLRTVLLDQCDHVARRLRRHGLAARVVVLKVRTADFKTFTRRTTLATATDASDTLAKTVGDLFEAWTLHCRAPIRLIGTGVSQLSSRTGQQGLLFEDSDQIRRRRLDQTIDSILDRYGFNAIGRGSSRRAGDP